MGLQATTGGASVNLFDPASFFIAAGPRLYWPFFNYGRIENRVRVEDARFQQVLISYQNSVLKASQEVEDGIVGFLKALEATTAQQEAVTAARRSVELASIQYLDGAVDFLRVLDAERSQLQEENNLVRLRSSVATNAISLYKALGGGWEGSVGQPFVNPANTTIMQQRTNWGDLLSTQPDISVPPLGPSTESVSTPVR
jgi:outer membrane protein TolC